MGATGTGPAAHQGAACRQRAHGTDSCAADGGPIGGFALAPRYADSRAGCRSAQDLVVIPSFSQGGGRWGTAQVSPQIVDLPVRSGGRQGFRLGQGSQRTARQTVDIPAGEGPQGLLPDPGVALSAVSREEAGEGFFARFPV